jgi:2-polyprenyl-6-methoxyphenol hydroxylase-like FAD-dependent oxidoreductase
LHPPALQHLEKLGLGQQLMACGAPVRWIEAQTRDNRQLMKMAYADLAAEPAGLGIQRGTLHRLLAQADSGREQVLGGRRITTLDAQRGILRDDSHRQLGPFDLIVIADGTHSALRTRLPELVRHDRRSDCAAVVGLLDDHDGFAADRLMQRFDGPRHLSIWPVGVASPAAPRRCSIAMNTPFAQAADLIERGIWRTQLTHLYPGIGRLLEADNSASSLHVFTWHDVELSNYSSGRAVLIGDAAHSMSPQLGIGAQMALEDAEVLAGVLAEHRDLATALRAYTRLREARLSRYQQASRWLTPLFQSDSQLLAMIRDRLLANAMQGIAMKSFGRKLLGL